MTASHDGTPPLTPALSGDGELHETARAKINLTLEIAGRRDDGFHELTSLVVFAAFGDALSLRPGAALSLTADGPFASVIDGDNLVLRAAAALIDAFPGLGAGAFHLTKTIPVAAGLGGGSADAAAALRALLRAAPVKPPLAQVMALAAGIGADIPVCLLSRPAVMSGMGERLGAPPTLPPLPAVLANPGVPLATAAVFAALQAPPIGGARPPTAAPAALQSSDALTAYLRARGNDLESPARRLLPVIGDVLDALARLDGCLLARLSGSGPTCFGLFTTPAKAADAARGLRRSQPHWWVRDTMLG